MAKEYRKGRTRINLDIPTVIYQDMRALTFHHSATMTALLTRALVEYINSQKEYLKPYRDAR